MGTSVSVFSIARKNLHRPAIAGTPFKSVGLFMDNSYMDNSYVVTP